MFNAAQYQKVYDRIIGPLAQDVIFQVNDGTQFNPSGTYRAHVSAYRETDLVPGGTLQLGDLKLIINYKEGMPSLTLKDRVTISGRSYAVVHWDQNTRTIGEDVIAIEAGVRG